LPEDEIIQEIPESNTNQDLFNIVSESNKSYKSEDKQSKQNGSCEVIQDTTNQEMT